jgi:hypothetical protein
VRELLGEKRELGEAAHCKQSMEDELAAGMRRRGEAGPYCIHCFALLERQCIERLYSMLSTRVELHPCN